MEEYGHEMLLVPGRLNNKKNHLFGVDGHNVISTDKFAKMSLHQKVDELRELVLLIKVSRVYTPLVQNWADIPST